VKIFYLLILVFINLSATSLTSKEDVQNYTKNVIEHISKGEISKGFDLMAEITNIPLVEFKSIRNRYKLQLPIIKERFGKSIGYEYIKTSSIGNSLMKITYIQKFQKHMMVWNFYFYKPEKEWRLNAFYTVDKIEMVFD